MPLDRVAGEILSGLEGEPYILAPLTKWADTTLWAAAYEDAIKAFAKAGATDVVRFAENQVLVQEYPLSDRLAFVFSARVPVSRYKRGDDQERVYKELYHPVIVRLSPGLKAELVMAGRWREMALN